MNRYQILLKLLILPIIIYTLWIAIKNKDLRYFTQRLGFNLSKVQIKQGNLIWIHAASVGEFNAAIPLIEKFNMRNTVLLTTNTPSSAARAQSIFSDSIQHYYLPIDWKMTTNKFLSKTNPKHLFIIETELWPNLFLSCKSQNIPITIINGRLSEKTVHAAKWLTKRYAECLQSVNFVFTRSDEDSKRFIALGAKKAIVKTIGNIKYYHNNKISSVKAFKTTLPYVLAASTRDDEEMLLVKAWIQSQQTSNTKHLLVIVPRHPKRLTTIMTQLSAFNLDAAIRSKNEKITNETEIYIADTFGELVSFIAGAEFVLMGGSFVNKGGQNILEVAQAHKTVVFGPYMSNFKDEAELFIKQRAGIQVESIETLPDTIQLLLDKPEVNVEFQENAKQLIQQQENILELYLTEISQSYSELNI